MLIGATALVVAVLGTGCGVLGVGQPPTEPAVAPPVDPLLAISAAARADAAMATQAATAAPTQAGGLATIAAERTAHADALDAEIVRAAGKLIGGPSLTPTTSLASSPTTPAAAPPVATLDRVRAALQHSQTTATELAATVADYRAGLLGSVAASCAAELAVLL